MDDLLNTESASYNKGKSIGNEHGEELAKHESQAYGFKAGLELADEIGSYQGILDVMEGMLQHYPTYNEKKERVEKVYKELKEQLEGFDVTFDPFNKDFNTKITKIRSNFKILASLLKMKITSQDTEL